MPGNKKDMGEHEEHLWCGTPDCCMSCDTAVPVQLELFPDIFTPKDTKQDTSSFPLDTITDIS